MANISYLKTLGAISSVSKTGDFATIKLNNVACVSQFINLWIAIDGIYHNSLAGHFLNCGIENMSLTGILTKARETRIFTIPLNNNATTLEFFYTDDQGERHSAIFHLN